MVSILDCAVEVPSHSIIINTGLSFCCGHAGFPDSYHARVLGSVLSKSVTEKLIDALAAPAPPAPMLGADDIDITDDSICYVALVCHACKMQMH
jgi:hypothetical protein